MVCVHCGALLPERANFCPQCGLARAPVQERECIVQFRQIDEKWSLFGKEIWRFEAVSEDGSVVAVSDTVTITGFELLGANEKNRKHKAALDKLIGKLLKAGWEPSGKQGTRWYEKGFILR